MDVWSEVKEVAVAQWLRNETLNRWTCGVKSKKQWLIAPSEPGFKAHWYPYESLVVVCVCVCVCLCV